jgi:hypothetical protein
MIVSLIGNLISRVRTWVARGEGFGESRSVRRSLGDPRQQRARLSPGPSFRPVSRARWSPGTVPEPITGSMTPDPRLCQGHGSAIRRRTTSPDLSLPWACRYVLVCPILPHSATFEIVTIFITIIQISSYGCFRVLSTEPEVAGSNPATRVCYPLQGQLLTAGLTFWRKPPWLVLACLGLPIRHRHLRVRRRYQNIEDQPPAPPASPAYSAQSTSLSPTLLLPKTDRRFDSA